MKKVGIIGCGHISDTHIKSWKKTKNSVIHGLFDLSTELAEKKRAKYNVGTVYQDLDKLIAECDVLDVCTPPQSHFDICMQIIKAGKDLLIEKPVVTDVEQWKTIKAAVEEAGVKLGVCHNLKFNLSVQKAKQRIEKGEIGDLIRINRYFLTHPDYDRMLKGDNHWSHKLPGGRWYETMPHELYITHFFAGESVLDNVSVISTDRATVGAPADEVCFTLSNDKVISNYHYSSNCRLNKRSIELIGTDGTLVLDVLSDMMFLDRVKETKNKRAFGILFIEAMSRVLQALPDRISYFSERMKGISPHTRIILQFDAYLDGKAPSPTPIEEIDFVIRYCDIVGKEIDAKLVKS
ncbi:Gfo/Idh/MocA family protein [Roseivirga echinicomitans]